MNHFFSNQIKNNNKNERRLNQNQNRKFFDTY